jgi:hypothetical protein
MIWFALVVFDTPIEPVRAVWSRCAVTPCGHYMASLNMASLIEANEHKNAQHGCA